MIAEKVPHNIADHLIIVFDDVLKKKVTEYLFNVPDIKKGGHFFYQVMMTMITSNTEEIHTLTLKKL